jgi:hypothetical protein
MGAEYDQRAPLPPHYAFVVQWAIDTQIEAGRIHGRVEHVVSRHATRFTSLEELLAFMARVLREVAARDRPPRAPLRRFPPPSYAACPDRAAPRSTWYGRARDHSLHRSDVQARGRLRLRL